MERLYYSSCESQSEEQQGQLIEKALLNVVPGRDLKTRSVGWLILEKILRTVNPGVLRKFQARLGKRLPDISANPDLCSGIFVRQLLIKNPQIGDLQSSSIDKIIFDLLDYAILNEDDDYRRLAIDMFAIRHGSSETEKIVKTIEGSLKNTLISPEERLDMLPLGCLGAKEVRERFINYLLELFSVSISAAKRGSKLNRDSIFSMFEKTLADSISYASALKAISSFCLIGKSSVLPYIPRIVSMLIVHLAQPVTELFETLLTISEAFGASSTLYKHFFVIFSSLKRPLCSQDSSRAAVALLSSIIRTSAAIMKAEVLISVQRTILEEVMRSDNIMVYEKLLEAFLANSHESVPVPVHVIRNLVSSKRKNSSSYFLSTLCDALSRPRLQNLSDGVIKNMAVAPEVISAGKPIKEPVSDDFYDTEVQKALEEAKESEDAAIESPVVPVEKMVVAPSGPKTSKSNLTTQVTSKRESKDNTTTTAVKSKKAKKNEKTKKTVLLEGEASVDDILDSFCPT
ncbi:unnamed protein product [Auanema sp. JU1783]|nr:unnamed protein product [Auanema sp. JU1783]